MIHSLTLFIYKDIIKDILKENNINVDEKLINRIQYAPDTKFLNLFINQLVELIFTGSDTKAINEHFLIISTNTDEEEK